ncbi:MAG: alginate export family protein [Candidatus Hydrogenedentota bacterium]
MLKNVTDKLSIGGEVRARTESRQNFDLNETRDDENSFTFLRTRVNFKLDATDDISAYIQFQDARTFGDEPSTVNDDASVDLRQGYFDVRKLWGTNAAVRVGRQELSYGSERLIGALDWSNVGRSFDAVKFTAPVGKMSFDLFGATLTESNANDNDLNLFGLVGTYKDTPVTFMPYIFYKRDGRGNFVSERNAFDTGKLDQYTAGAYGIWKVTPDLTLDAEGAIQFGTQSSDDIKAWAAHVQGAYRLMAKHDVTVSLEGNWATGDKNATDGKREGFDNLYPTNHKFYGYADFFQWSNLENYRAGISFKPWASTTVAADYHIFRLNTPADAWRNAFGGVVRAARTFTSENIGDEIDVTIKHKYRDHMDFLAGYSILLGDQVMTASNQKENAQFWYLQSRMFF